MGAKRQSVAITDGACLLRMIVRGVPKAVLGIISQSGVGTMEVLRLHSIMARSWDGINTCWAVSLWD
ncbi:hypothetical protein CY34DRAFT_797009 [Suillus luteus UH-Slu-Lm8-n1]|uniref:Uncharacterized protein n=1 Tax=Suillus luteus UH-Slu-Lm8-n1 TaxID=930992 RepID=A0A0D0B6B2_9AGAM|nr:hypothetical protein CY34DRAFT_797009 [Suillus luteus UH-Slu-Lm8-n1]